MSETETTPRRKHPVLIFMAGVGTFAFLFWLAWLTTRLIVAGIPEEDRAGLAETMVLSASGLVLTAITAALASGETNPLSFVSSFVSAVRSLLTRRPL